MGRIRIEALSHVGINGKHLRVKGQDVRVILTTDDGRTVDLTKELAIKSARWTVNVDSRGSYASAHLEVEGAEIVVDLDERDVTGSRSATMLDGGTVTRSGPLSEALKVK